MRLVTSNELELLAVGLVVDDVHIERAALELRELRALLPQIRRAAGQCDDRLAAALDNLYGEMWEALHAHA